MRCLLLTLALVFAAAVMPAEAAAFHYTHKVEITADVTDNWSTNEPGACGIQGSGSVTASLKTNGSTRIRPIYSKYGGRPVGRKLGILVLGVPGGGGYTHMGTRKASGTITTVDNTTTAPPDNPEDPCLPIKKDGCGTFPVKHAFISVSGYDPTHLYGKAGLSGGIAGSSRCQTGNLEDWAQPHEVAGGFDFQSDMLFGPTSARKIARKRTTVLTQTDHKVTTITRNNGIVNTDDVTRKITITITKL